MALVMGMSVLEAECQVEQNVPFTLAPCGRDKSSDPISAFLKQEVHFQNIEHMANGCQQPGFHSFYHGKT